MRESHTVITVVFNDVFFDEFLIFNVKAFLY